MQRTRLPARSDASRVSVMISLNDSQLGTVMAAAARVPHEKRAQFLERISAMLTFRGRGHFRDDDVAEVTQLALVGLVHESAAWCARKLRSLRCSIITVRLRRTRHRPIVGDKFRELCPKSADSGFRPFLDVCDFGARLDVGR